MRADHLVRRLSLGLEASAPRHTTHRSLDRLLLNLDQLAVLLHPISIGLLPIESHGRLIVLLALIVQGISVHVETLMRGSSRGWIGHDWVGSTGEVRERLLLSLVLLVESR